MANPGTHLKSMRKAILLNLAGFLCMLVPGQTTPAASQVKLERVGQGFVGPGTTQYYYLFENERFTTPLVEVGFDSQGHGKFRFQRKDAQEIVNELSVSPALVNQIKSLFDELNFLQSNEEYQYKKDFSHLGKITIRLTQTGHERTASFNYTTNPTLNRLVELFRNIATQETRVFEIEAIRESDPISTPAQLRLLENELRSKQIAEPERLASLLEQIKVDESVPLIARNHADRLLKLINKRK
jgi:hypothetical protein